MEHRQRRLTWGTFTYILTVIAFCVMMGLSIYFFMKAFYFDRDVKADAVPEPEYHFVLIPEEMNNDYWRLVEQGARDAAEKYGVSVEYTGPQQADLEEHIESLEMAAAAKVDGILTQGLKKEEFTPLINKITAKGIPVVTVDTDAPGSNRAAYVGTDNYYSGYLAGQELIEDTGGHAKVAIITGRLDASHQKLRVQGFKDAVAKAPGIEVVAVEESNITRIQAAEKTYKILKEHPEVTAFFGTSALDGIGIASVVKSMDRKGDLYILAFDTLPETLQLIREGIINGTVVQRPYEMGYMSVKIMLDLLEGKTVEEQNFTETKVLNKENLSENGIGVLGP
ncbi:sugar-binding protein [Bacillus marinisedimentorum]|uniref:sugar-binding protein n=1 Tax=Bacillus marinisedimentorum TaxID=1821260 RepID=UPI000AD43AA3|nr:sugar-binding protein [Bacillus marinisedimentorum]